MNDAELLRGVQRHEAAAWELLCERYLNPVWRYAYALVGEATIAEDIVSETWLALVEKVSSLDPERLVLLPWLLAVARHKVHDHYRRQTQSHRLPQQLVFRQATPSLLPPSDPTAELLRQEELRQTIAAVLETLSPRGRLVLEWKYADALSVREIAHRLGETEKSVESLLFRARREFRQRFLRRERQMTP